MQLSKITLPLLVTILAVNLVSAFLLLPYAQQTANSHMNEGSFIGTIYYIISVSIAVAGITALASHKNKNQFLLFLVFSATLAYWGYRLHSLYCLGCANGG